MGCYPSHFTFRKFHKQLPQDDDAQDDEPNGLHAGDNDDDGDDHIHHNEGDGDDTRHEDTGDGHDGNIND